MKFRTLLQRIFNKSLPQGDKVIREGLRLAVWNLGYIFCCIAIAVGLISAFTVNGNIKIMPGLLVSFVAVAVVGICYFLFWGRFTGRFAGLVREKWAAKTFSVSLLGVIPNLFIFLFLPDLFRWVFGSTDACGGILIYLMVYLIFICSTVAMPIVGLVGAAMRKPA